MAEEAPASPLGRYQVLRWGDEPSGPTSNAPADPPAASVAVVPEPETPAPAESDEPPEGEVLPDGSADAPEGEGGEEGEPVETEAADQPQRPRRPIQPRLSELTQERNAAREAAQAEALARAKAEGRAEALQALWDQQQVSQQQQRAREDSAAEAPRVPDDGLTRDAQGYVQRPLEHLYATTEAYAQALQTYDQARDEERYRAFAVRYGQEQRQAQAQAAAQAAIAQARERYPNFERLVNQVPYQFGPAAQAAINDSPHWASVIAYLAEHPDEARTLHQAPLREAVRAVERIEAQWAPPPGDETPTPRPAAAAESPPRQTTPPPLPATPTRGRTEVAPAQRYEDMSFMDFFARRNAEERASRR